MATIQELEKQYGVETSTTGDEAGVSIDALEKKYGVNQLKTTLTIDELEQKYNVKPSKKPSGAGGGFEKGVIRQEPDLPWYKDVANALWKHVVPVAPTLTQKGRMLSKAGLTPSGEPIGGGRTSRLDEGAKLLDLMIGGTGGIAGAKYLLPKAGKAIVKRSLFGGPKAVAQKAVPETITDPNTPLYNKIRTAIRGRQSLRGKQEQLYKIDRAERFAKVKAVGEKIPGEAGYHAQLRELKGPMTKQEFKSIRSKFSQAETDELFNIIEKSTEVVGPDNVTAKRGMANLLGVEGGKLPTEGELHLLGKIFPKNLIDDLKKARPLWTRMKQAGLQLANIPRSIMSSYDLSAAFRQGLYLIPTNPKGSYRAFKGMFKQFGSERAYKAAQESIKQNPAYELAKEGGLSLTELGSTMLKREEVFMSQWAEKIPAVGKGVKASAQAYTGFLNKQRIDTFEYLIDKAERLGRDPKNNMDLVKEIAGFVNIASGRGPLGALENSAVALNATLFSPRLIASRLTLLNPVYYIKADRFVRKEALKSLFSVTGAVGTILGLAKAGGAGVGLDPRSADFLKLKIGNTRIDMLGGVQQYMRAAGQLITGKYVSSTTGKVVTLGEGYRPLTRLEIALRFGESKLSPIASFATTLLKGQDFEGKEISVPKEIGKRFVPMVIQDVYDLATEDPELLPVSLLGVFGVGLQTYKPRSRLKGGIKGIGPLKEGE